MIHGEWKAHLAFDWSTGNQRLSLFCRDSRHVTVWRSDGAFQVLTDDGGTALDIEPPRLPMEALIAIRDAVDEAMGKRVPEQVIDELRKALEHERGRVDRTLDRLTPGTP